MDLAVPVLLLAGGELFLAAIGLRIAVWVVRGWREWRAVAGPGAPPGPRGPGGGLRPLPGGRGPAASPLRDAA
jgi:hypothetical protein